MVFRELKRTNVTGRESTACFSETVLTRTISGDTSNLTKLNGNDNENVVRDIDCFSAQNFSPVFVSESTLLN